MSHPYYWTWKNTLKIAVQNSEKIIKAQYSYGYLLPIFILEETLVRKVQSSTIY